MEVITGDLYSSTMGSEQLAARQSSIDKEPRTLNIRQLDFAREEAQSVVNTRNMEEALKVFTEGLSPVVIKGADADADVNGSLGRMARYEDDEFPNYNTGRDVVSAPF